MTPAMARRLYPAAGTLTFGGYGGAEPEAASTDAPPPGAPPLPPPPPAPTVPAARTPPPEEAAVRMDPGSDGAKLAIVGLDNAGKTTLLGMLKSNKFEEPVPTSNSSVVELALGGVNLQVYDMPGHETARRLWKQYGTAVDAIVFLLDSGDGMRFREAKEELQALQQEPLLNSVPLVVLASKMDLPGAATEGEVRTALELDEWTCWGRHRPYQYGPQRAVEVFPCSVVQRWGYMPGLAWLLAVVAVIKRDGPDPSAAREKLRREIRDARRARRRARLPFGWSDPVNSDSPDSDCPP